MSAERIERTVFISYRRTNLPWALNVFQNLTQHRFDAFLDYQGIASGDFESIIVENIKARAHFLVLLTPSALEGCDEPGDWLCREIEIALNAKRNIIPLLLEGFDFDTPAIAGKLTGKLQDLRRYNALSIPPEYFLEGMERLREKYLNIPLNAVLHPPSARAELFAREQKAAAGTAQAVKTSELTAQHWFERGVAAKKPDKKLHFFNEAIRLKPDFSRALFNRGILRTERGDLDGAFRDLSEAINLDPSLAKAFFTRGNIKQQMGDLDGAIRDFNEAIRLNPNLDLAFNARGIVRARNGDNVGGAKDLDEAIRLIPDDPTYLCNRGIQRFEMNYFDGALKDLNRAIALDPTHAQSFNARGLVKATKGDFDGALQDFNEAIHLNPSFTAAIDNRKYLLRRGSLRRWMSKLFSKK
jgi:tetratricopeptide (TPR) repeat protein